MSRGQCVSGAMAFLLSISAAAFGDDVHAFKESYVDPRNPKLAVAIFANSAGAEYIIRSEDGGKSWSKLASTGGTPIRRYGRQDQSDFFVDAGPPITITYTSGGISRAGADGKWTELTGLEEPAQKLIPTSSATQFFVLTAGKDGKTNVFRTDDGGHKWTKVGSALPFDCNPLFSICEVGAAADGGKIAVQNGGRDGYLSEDGGKTWKTSPAAMIAKEVQALEALRVKHAIKDNPAQISAAKRALEARMTAK